MEWNEACSEKDSLKFLSPIYYKIMKIDLSTEAYQCLKGGDIQGMGQGEPLSAWLHGFVEADLPR